MNIKIHKIHDKHSTSVPGPDRNYAAAPGMPGNRGRPGSGHPHKSGSDERRRDRHTPGLGDTTATTRWQRQSRTH